MQEIHEFENWLLSFSESDRRDIAGALTSRLVARVFPTLTYAIRADGLRDDSASKIMQSYFRSLINSAGVVKYSFSPTGIVNNRVFPFRRFEANVFTSNLAYSINSNRNIAFSSRKSYSYVKDLSVSTVKRIVDLSYSISKDAARDIWREISHDCEVASKLHRKKGSKGNWFDLEPIMSSPIWRERPDWFDDLWRELRHELLSREGHWDVWVNSYDGFVSGGGFFYKNPVVDRRIFKLLLSLDSDFWSRSTSKTNSDVAAIVFNISSHLRERGFEEIIPSFPISPIDPLPLQGAGPHFELREDFLIDRADPSHLDQDGNNVKRIEQLRPFILQACRDLQVNLPKNVFPELLGYIDGYVDLLSVKDPNLIPWGEIWGLGILLRNASDAAERSIESRLLPEMEDSARAALTGLLALHAPMILATREGQELTDQAQAFNQTQDEMISFRKIADSISEAISRSPDIATTDAALMIKASANAVTQGAHPERGFIYGLSGLRNIMIPVVAAAVVSTPAAIGYALLGPAGVLYTAPASLLAIESLKKSKEFIALTSALGGNFDEFMSGNLSDWMKSNSKKLEPFRRFILENQDNLRTVSRVFTELSWIPDYIDAIIADDNFGRD